MTTLWMANYRGLKCKECGKKFYPSGQKRGPAPKYCSAACKQRHWRKEQKRLRGY